tara:strand:- start:32 stop:436 length:405 start_codon:yes stop_codon:yes gene_type:complete
MASTLAHGSDGSVTLPADFEAQINTWSATLTRATSVVTGFGDTGARRRASSVLDMTGSAGGITKYGASTHNPTGINTTSSSAQIVLTVATGCTFTLDAIVNSTAFSVTQDGDSTVSFNFEMDDANGPLIAWDEG